jgi:hypothetical protein
LNNQYVCLSASIYLETIALRSGSKTLTLVHIAVINSHQRDSYQNRVRREKPIIAIENVLLGSLQVKLHFNKVDGKQLEAMRTHLGSQPLTS